TSPPPSGRRWVTPASRRAGPTETGERDAAASTTAAPSFSRRLDSPTRFPRRTLFPTPSIASPTLDAHPPARMASH
ncbi:MAG TPA: hypothetical protein VNE61_03875, partial [Ktedonobacteraceae bacterium]|nr:hypothetical protein [Ktedonobacteraceae bacterium]